MTNYLLIRRLHFHKFEYANRCKMDCTLINNLFVSKVIKADVSDIQISGLSIVPSVYGNVVFYDRRSLMVEIKMEDDHD